MPPPSADLLARYEKAGGRFMVCPICFNAKHSDEGSLLPNAELGRHRPAVGNGSVTMVRPTFSY